MYPSIHALEFEHLQVCTPTPSTECNRLNLSSIRYPKPMSIMECTDILTSKKLIGGGGEQSPGGRHGGYIHITSFGSQNGHPSHNVPSGFVCKKM